MAQLIDKQESQIVVTKTNRMICHQVYTMTPTEEYYLKVRNKLDELGYFQPLSFDSVLLVDKLMEDLLDTKRNLQHYKNVAQQSMEVKTK